MAALRFNSKKERYDWMLKHSATMVEELQKFKQAFGDIKLSGVGFNDGVEVQQPEKVNIWEGYGLKTK